MATGDPLALRIVIDDPVAGTLHSLQSGDGHPLDPRRAVAGQPLAFDLAIRVAPGPRFLGDFVRREGPDRRFVYVRVGQSAGDHASPWSRRMKIDIHDIPRAMLAKALESGKAIELRINGTASDGTPACATIRPVDRRLLD